MTHSDPATPSFRTVWQAHPAPYQFSASGKMVAIGSCFADNIGEQLRRRMVNIAVNPCGVLFNPLSIKAVIDCALFGREPEYVYSQGKWLSWLLPGEFADADEQRARTKGREAVARLHEYLLTADTLIVTFGTAIVYVLQEPPFPVVGNCHKHPANTFLRDMITPGVIEHEWTGLLRHLLLLNPKLHVVFTVSPVRHLREGFHQNALSKASLLMAADAIAAANERCSYFPAYEIMTDDLRDYRFYAADMLHPSPVAVDYILRAFLETYFPADQREILAEALTLRQREEHRPLHPGSPQDHEFRQATDRLIARFLEQHPGMTR